MMGRTQRALALGCLIMLAGCSATRPMVHPQPWDKHAGETLRVHGADPASDGPMIYRALRDQPRLRRFLDRQGEPDTLEVRGGRWSAKTIVLFYTRPSAGPARMIMLEPSDDGFLPHAPVPLGTPHPAATPAKRRPPRSKPEATRTAPDKAERSEPGTTREEAPRTREEDAPRSREETAPRKGTPSAEQALGCPIDPSRPDCQAFCTPGADHEWCNQ